jgi:TPR repeat protein
MRTIVFVLLCVVPFSNASADQSVVVQAISQGDWTSAYAEADRLAAAEDPMGLYWKGMILGGEIQINNRPKNLPIDRRAGAELVLKAAEAGVVGAYSVVSRYYELGAFGFPKDKNIAIHWAEQAMHLALPNAIDKYRNLTGTKSGDLEPAAHAGRRR